MTSVSSELSVPPVPPVPPVPSVPSAPSGPSGSWVPMEGRSGRVARDSPHSGIAPVPGHECRRHIVCGERVVVCNDTHRCHVVHVAITTASAMIAAGSHVSTSIGIHAYVAGDVFCAVVRCLWWGRWPVSGEMAEYGQDGEKGDVVMARRAARWRGSALSFTSGVACRVVCLDGLRGGYRNAAA